MASVTLRGILLAAVLGSALVTAVPATADPLPDPVSGLVGERAADRDQRDQSRAQSKGRTRAPDGRLRSGCRNYPYRYRLNIRTNDWTLETFLDDRTDETIASGAYTAGPDPKRNRVHFRFCRYATHAGRFTIRAKLVWYTDSGEHQTWLKPSHFRLRRP